MSEQQSNVDENLLTAAKLREQATGEIPGHSDLLEHAGLVEDSDHRNVITFLDQVTDDWHASELGTVLGEKLTTDQASRAVLEGDSVAMSHLVGVTEQDLDASALRLPLMLLEEIENNGAPCFLVGTGNPNTGKTNTMLLLAELRRADLDELLVIGNFASSLVDHRVTGAHDLAVTCLEHRNVPKFVIVDEASTHFDSRTYRREVATQWTPLAKRFAKIGVDTCGIIGHSGKDIHPECKRLATLPYFKPEQKRAEFYDRWPADSDFPADQIFGGSLEELQATDADYSADDAAPWSWDLEPELFAQDLTWTELLEELQARGPDTT